MTNELIQLIAACEGAFVLGISIVVMFHYLSLPEPLRFLKLHVVLITMSYNSLIVCTLISIFSQWYDPTSLWKVLALVGYSLGDISLVVLLRKVSRRNTQEKHKKTSNN